jgi:RES domain-containing protein
VVSTLGAGTRLVRIFDPSRHGATPTGFRYSGPRSRFDHHVLDADGPMTSERGIYYAAFSLSGCLVEVFGDAWVIEFREKHVARPSLVRDMHLLDLRGNGAMRAGTVAALTKAADYALTWAWSRYFYENEAMYTRVDGIWYSNAHNDEDAVALYERACDALVCRDEDVRRLDDEELRASIIESALRTGLIL